ncbi:serine/threonine-protein kinase [Roseateles sp. GG27B]
MASTSAPLPAAFGKYAVTGLLGEGAMGVVYKAFDPGIGRAVAIKTIRRGLDGDTSLADRFANEARAVGRMNHPGIVSIYELGQTDDTAFIVMEYVEGRDLSRLLAASAALPEAYLLKLMLQLLDALEYAHARGVWHRDIKPANLIVTSEGQLKITDFGIARIESAAITQVVSTIGTPGYMAPEQYIGEQFDHRVDVFAAGVLLYRLLTGKAPFAGTGESVMYHIMHTQPQPLRELLAPDLALL